MQKVAKDYLSTYNFDSKPTNPSGSADSIDFMVDVLHMREYLSLAKLGSAMKGAGKDKTRLFDSWMYNASDLVQHAAMSYAELFMAQSLLSSFQSCPPDCKDVMQQLLTLYLSDTISQNMSFLIMNHILTTEQAQTILTEKQKVISQLSTISLSLTESFGLPVSLLRTPISSNWVSYNDHNNEGEIDF